MKRIDFFKGLWLSPAALLRGPETLTTVGQVFSVKSFGARGDGTNQTAGIQAAINAASAYSTVVIEAGTYIIGTITITKGCVLGRIFASSSRVLVRETRCLDPAGRVSEAQRGITLDGSSKKQAEIGRTHRKAAVERNPSRSSRKSSTSREKLQGSEGEGVSWPWRPRL